MSHHDVQVLVTPAGLAPDDPAGQELIDLSEATDEDGRLSQEALRRLASSSWLRQDEQGRGAWITTKGLGAYDHPELKMRNVPSVFVARAVELMNQISDHVKGGSVMKPGEIFGANDRPAWMVTFLEDEDGFLVVLPLP